MQCYLSKLLVNWGINPFTSLLKEQVMFCTFGISAVLGRSSLTTGQPRNLMLEKIPLNMSTNQLLRRHFDEAYPDLHVLSSSLLLHVQ